MTETGKFPANPTKKPSMTPKAIIHQQFGDKACYKVEEVQDLTQSGCPGLAIRQKGPCLYQCTLHLPDAVVVSDTCRRKKDAEQSAAEKAIEKLGIRQTEYNPSVEDAWDDLASRIAILFANEFLLSLHPLSGHVRAALRREGHSNGCVPISVIAVYDSKICNICKYINPAAEANLLLVMSLVLKAAAKRTDVILISDERRSLRRRNPYPSEIIASINHESSLSGSILIEVIRIPASLGKPVDCLTLNIAATGYYLDVIACELGVADASNILISRVIGKASSEMRIYSSAPEQLPFDGSSEPKAKQASHLEGSLNDRASYFAGQEVYGNAILASVGYTWKSTDLLAEPISLRLYYRMLVNKIPSGIYQISRDAILAAKLPLTFTTKSNWRGFFPRDVLCTFCRVHHLSEPVFSTQNTLLDSPLDLPGSSKKQKVTHSSEEGKSEAGLATTSTPDSVGPNGAFICEVKIYSKNQELILQCSPQGSHRKQNDAIQSTSLKVLSWLNIFFFESPEISLDKLKSFSDKLDINFTPHYFLKEFALCHSAHNFRSIFTTQASSSNDETSLNDIGGQNSGITPANGSLTCISYTASLFSEGDRVKEHLESCEEFEFEIGNEAVLPQLEAAVAQMAVGQSACFRMELLPSEFILAAARDSVATLSLLSSSNCKLEYSITLLQVTEPLEDRMEQALFSPPLSKQRVEFAVQHIKESSAASLVDFGCGSGSLLESLLSYPTSLEKIVGVDLSTRSLAKAAKSFHTKLNRLLDSKEPSSHIKSAVLFDGSITEFDSRVCGFDIAACLEVIEHMVEEDACLFGDIALGSFCPKIFIVSTPNYEYNVILQKSTQEDDPDEKNERQSCKFRNHDHKFEWNRAQFEQWASDLAARHNYDVEFSGVGGAADVEPGFASQIAIFRRRRDNVTEDVDLACNYAPIWEWRKEEDLDPK
ncbi:hypothetical protein OROHE_010204 [Orobanche hederae]